MKKVLSLVAVLALLSTATFAQVKFGAKVGTNISNISMSSDAGFSLDTKSRVGFLVGGFAKFELSEAFAIQPELMFAQYGYKVDMEFFGETISGTETANYLAIPVMAKYYFGGFNLQAGPQLGFLMSANAEADGETEDTKGDYNSIDLGLSFGAGYDLEMGLGFDLRYNTGLTNIAKDAEGVTVKNNAIQIAVNYTF